MTFFPEEFEAIETRKLKTGERVVTAGDTVAVAGEFGHLTVEGVKYPAMRIDEVVAKVPPFWIGMEGDSIQLTVTVHFIDGALSIQAVVE